MTQKSQNPNDHWRGKRCICLARQSDDSNGTTSTRAQLELLKNEGSRRGMIHVDDVVLEGVTGSLPGKRNDLEQLIERKRRDDDFDVLLIQRLDRLTRGGSDHGGWFHHEAAKAGIDVIYPGDDIPEDSNYRGMIMAAKFDAARDQARSISQRSVQGWMHSISNGYNCVISRTPFGCDRLYLREDGTPLFIIRSLGDGRQQKLHPDTHQVIDTYGQIGGGAKGHYRKQKNERVLIVPGDQGKAETVRLIFEMRYHKGWRGKRIADLLNRRGIASPTGRQWSQRQVESIYSNPIYCGLALGNFVSQGIYYRRGRAAPDKVELDPKVLANCQTPPRQTRTPDDWIHQEQPLMKAFLPERLAERALSIIKAERVRQWERSQNPTIPKRSSSKHQISPYLLTDLLVAKQDGALLTGVLCGTPSNRKRYYRHRRGRIGYLKGSIYNKLIPAREVEMAVVNLVRSVIVDAPFLRERIKRLMKPMLPAESIERNLKQLAARRDELSARVRSIAQTFSEASIADARPELDRIDRQRQELDQQIADCHRAIERGNQDPDEVADRVIARLKTIDAEFEDLEPAAVREFLKAFVEGVEVDMVTKNIVVNLILVPWAMPGGEPPMRLADSSSSQTSCETHLFLALPLGTAICSYERLGNRVCYDCRRSRRAA